jgi:hypothetical protein
VPSSARAEFVGCKTRDSELARLSRHTNLRADEPEVAVAPSCTRGRYDYECQSEWPNDLAGEGVAQHECLIVSYVAVLRHPRWPPVACSIDSATGAASV